MGVAMKRVAIVAFALLGAGCSSSSGGPPSLDQVWIYQNSAGTAGQSVSFKSDGTYEFSELQVVSSTSINAQVETGTFTTSGDLLTNTPLQWSCRGADPGSTLTYQFNGGDLEFIGPTGILQYVPDTTPASAAGGLALVIGCFDTQGNFTPQALAPIESATDAGAD
jgi:hypothetical protein